MRVEHVGVLQKVRIASQRTNSRRPLQRAFQPCLDRLEGRELKDGGISLVAGTVTISARDAVNVAVVSYADSNHSTIAVNWNNTEVDFAASSVSGIRFVGQGSTNIFQNFTSVASTATGGDGFNFFVGFSGDDNFQGGNGFNVFWVAPGHNTLVAGNGANYIYGAGASDSVTVGNGFNVFA
jgi:hypothetical protein